MGQEVSGDLHGIHEELRILDPDVDVHPEDQVLPGQILKVFLHAEIPLERRDLLIHPRGEGVSACREHRASVLGCQVDDRPSKSHNLGADFGRRRAHPASDLDHRLVQLGLDALDRNLSVRIQDLSDVRTQLARLRIDDLVLFLDPEGQRRLLHGQIPSMMPFRVWLGHMAWVVIDSSGR